MYASQSGAEDGLINYVRSARGEWQIANQVDRDDPWNRLLLLSPRRPVVIDLAVLIDGKPYRAVRETWIDEVLESAKSPGGALQKPETTAVKGTSAEMDSSKDEPPQAPAEVHGDAEKQEQSDEKKPTDTNSKKVEETASTAIPTVAAQVRQAPAIRERLMNYLATIGPSVSREEIRWLLAEWGSGPPLVVLGPGLSWQRAATAPLLAFLDSDKDAGLSPSEIASMSDRLMKADLDANEVVELGEMRRADARPAALPYSVGYPLLVTIDENTNWQSLAAELSRL
jgi:hypothetical protein